MSEFTKSLVEAEVLLNQLEPKYKNKIPNEFWKLVQENKDKDYEFYIDFAKTLEDQKLMSDTIAILTYVNMQYLLNDEQKDFFRQLLTEDEKTAELEKKKLYNANLFPKKSKNKNINYNLPIEANNKWYIKIIQKIRELLKK